MYDRADESALYELTGSMSTYDDGSVENRYRAVCRREYIYIYISVIRT